MVNLGATSGRAVSYTNDSFSFVELLASLREEFFRDHQDTSTTSTSGAENNYVFTTDIFNAFCYSFILLSGKSDQSALTISLIGVAGHLSTTPNWG